MKKAILKSRCFTIFIISIFVLGSCKEKESTEIAAENEIVHWEGSIEFSKARFYIGKRMVGKGP